MYVDYVRVYKNSDNYNDVSVNFKVDMKNQTVSETGVWLSGGNLSSGQPGGIQMVPSVGSNIWELTLTLPPNSSYTYKFRNGYLPNSWQGGWEILDNNCGVGEYNDRSLTVSDIDTLLPPVCFGECIICD